MSRLFLFFLILASCRHTSPVDLEKERKEILRLEADQKNYHLHKDARSLTDMFSNHFMSISTGSVDSPSRKESFEKFNRYFSKAIFVKWDDIKEPVIRFSSDGSIAYVALQKQVVLKLARRDTSYFNDTTDFAWLTIYKKENAGWKIDCVASTNK